MRALMGIGQLPGSGPFHATAMGVGASQHRFLAAVLISLSGMMYCCT